MQTQTAGHLTNNGGLCAHSVGLIYPYRIMAQGADPDNLTWWVINPQGEKCAKCITPEGAQVWAELIRDGYLKEHNYN